MSVPRMICRVMSKYVVKIAKITRRDIAQIITPIGKSLKERRWEFCDRGLDTVGYWNQWIDTKVSDTKALLVARDSFGG